MKRKHLIALFATLVMLTGYSNNILAKGVKVKSGSISALKSEKSIKIQIDYDGVRVGKDSEKDYVNKKVNEYNAKEKGKGDKWKEGWEGNRTTRYNPAFTGMFNKVVSKKLTASESVDAKYTLIVKVVVIEPGFNVGVMKKPAYVDFEFTVVETANPAKPVCELLLDKVPGSQYSGYDFDAGTRIAEAFSLGGKILGKYFMKNLK